MSIHHEAATLLPQCTRYPEAFRIRALSARPDIGARQAGKWLFLLPRVMWTSARENVREYTNKKKRGTAGTKFKGGCLEKNT